MSQNIQTDNTNMIPGFVSITGIGTQSTPSGAVKAQTALQLISQTPDKNNGMMLMDRDDFDGTPTIIGEVRGHAEAFKFSLEIAATPESLDKLLTSGLGAPTTTVASSSGTGVPSAISAATIAITQGGTPGAAATSYVIYARNLQGDSPSSASSATSTANASLTSTNYNIISWTGQPGANLYVVVNLTGNYIAGITNQLSLNDTGATGFTYSAPAAAVGNYQLYKKTSAFTYSTIPLYKGNDILGNMMVDVYTGCVLDKLQVDFDKTAKKPISLKADMCALWMANLPSEVNTGLTTMTRDLLDPWSGAFANCMIGCAGAGVNKYSLTIDNKLGGQMKSVFNGYAGGLAFIKDRAAVTLSLTLYWDDDNFQRQFWYSVANRGQSYSQQNGIIYTSFELVTGTIVNPSTGIVYEMGFLATKAAIKAQPVVKIDDKVLMQELDVICLYDPATGTDIQSYLVNSLSNATIIAPGTLITGISGGAVNPYNN